MSGNELYDDEDPKPGTRSKDGAGRRVSRVSAGEGGAGSKTGSRPTTSSSPRLAASQSRPTSSRPTSGRAAKPAAAPEPEPIDRPNTSTRAAVLLDDFDKKGGKDNTMLWVYSATGLLVVAGIIVVIMAVGKEGKKKQAFEDREAAVAGVMGRLRDAVATKPDNFDTNISLAGDALKVILDPAGMVVKEYPKERAEAEGIKLDMLARKEKKAADDANLALLVKTEAEINEFSKIKDLERQIKQLELIGNGMGKEYAERVKLASRTLTINRLKAAGQKADDEAQKAAGDFEAACRAYDEPMRTFRDFFQKYVPPKGPDGQPIKPDPAVDAYRQLLTKSDEWVAKLVTPEYMDKTTPRDMMSVVERKCWGGSKDGISAEWTGRELLLTHKPMPDGKKVMGVYSLDGWKVEWWDYAFEFEFEIIEGGFELLLRYRPDGYVYYNSNFVAGQAGYEKGQTYRLRVGLVGSKVTVDQMDQNSTSVDSVNATVSRTGGIGIALGTGSKIAIKSFQLKVFRPRGGK